MLIEEPKQGDNMSWKNVIKQEVQMRKRKNFRKKPKDNAVGLAVTVFNNNIEGALKVFKRKVKDSNMMVELREKQYYTKPSDKKREKKLIDEMDIVNIQELYGKN